MEIAAVPTTDEVVPLRTEVNARLKSLAEETALKTNAFLSQALAGADWQECRAGYVSQLASCSQQISQLQPDTKAIFDQIAEKQRIFEVPSRAASLMASTTDAGVVDGDEVATLCQLTARAILSGGKTEHEVIAHAIKAGRGSIAAAVAAVTAVCAAIAAAAESAASGAITEALQKLGPLQHIMSPGVLQGATMLHHIHERAGEATDVLDLLVEPGRCFPGMVAAAVLRFEPLAGVLTDTMSLQHDLDKVTAAPTFLELQTAAASKSTASVPSTAFLTSLGRIGCLGRALTRYTAACDATTTAGAADGDEVIKQVDRVFEFISGVHSKACSMATTNVKKLVDDAIAAATAAADPAFASVDAGQVSGTYTSPPTPSPALSVTYKAMEAIRHLLVTLEASRVSGAPMLLAPIPTDSINSISSRVALAAKLVAAIFGINNGTAAANQAMKALANGWQQIPAGVRSALTAAAAATSPAASTLPTATESTATATVAAEVPLPM